MYHRSERHTCADIRRNILANNAVQALSRRKESVVCGI
ncbi:MAG: hypothetical protein UY04_C0064G0002 [Parcubacteria group bacterium GW2011_GWA2_47_7]|nr:MAG: hypothetical protein UY04_C0064G0002 [Parcubacteria group bacterium GW2011_GWA2_47_7]